MSRPDLDDHCEDVMHLRLGLMSLKRLALDLVQEMVANDQLDKAEIEELPKRLAEMVFAGDVIQAVCPPGAEGEETQYCRERLRAGI